MAKTSFSPGTEVTAAWANAITNPTYAQNPSNDGELPAPTNADLSQAPGQVVPEWTTFRDTFAVTLSSGNVVAYQGGAVTLGSGLKATISAGTLAIPNGTYFVYVDSAGVVSSGIDLPIRSLPMAQLTMAGGALSGSIEDLRPRHTVSPRPGILSVFGSDGYEGDWTVTPGATVAVAGGQRRYRNITIGAGATVNVSPGFLKLQASGTVTISGTINLTPLIAGGQSFSGAVIPIQMQANPGQGLGGAAGHNSGPKASYSYSAEATSSSGASGFVWNFGSHPSGVNITSSTGGAGGGTLVIEAAGAINITGTINANGGNGTNPVVNMADAGGGSTYLTGAGGGSGGLIWLQSAVGITCSAASTLSVRGGNGGNGGGAALAIGPSGGGGGGGGGWLVFSSPLNQTTGSTLTLTGGTAGTSQSGGAGFGVSGSNGGSYAGQGGGSNTAGAVGQIVAINYLPI